MLGAGCWVLGAGCVRGLGWPPSALALAGVRERREEAHEHERDEGEDAGGVQ